MIVDDANNTKKWAVSSKEYSWQFTKKKKKISRDTSLDLN